MGLIIQLVEAAVVYFVLCFAVLPVVWALTKRSGIGRVGLSLVIGLISAFLLARVVKLDFPTVWILGAVLWIGLSKSEQTMLASDFRDQTGALVGRYTMLCARVALILSLAIGHLVLVAQRCDGLDCYPLFLGG